MHPQAVKAHWNKKRPKAGSELVELVEKEKARTTVNETHEALLETQTPVYQPQAKAQPGEERFKVLNSIATSMEKMQRRNQKSRDAALQAKMNNTNKSQDLLKNGCTSWLDSSCWKKLIGELSNQTDPSIREALCITLLKGNGVGVGKGKGKGKGQAFLNLSTVNDDMDRSLMAFCNYTLQSADVFAGKGLGKGKGKESVVARSLCPNGERRNSNGRCKRRKTSTSAPTTTTSEVTTTTTTTTRADLELICQNKTCYHIYADWGWKTLYTGDSRVTLNDCLGAVGGDDQCSPLFWTGTENGQVDECYCLYKSRLQNKGATCPGTNGWVEGTDDYVMGDTKTYTTYFAYSALSDKYGTNWKDTLEGKSYETAMLKESLCPS